MKRIKYAVLLLLLSLVSFSLAGCSVDGIISKINNYTEEPDTTTTQNYNTSSKVDAVESESVLAKIAKEKGYELTFLVTGDDEEGESTSFTIGSTENKAWYKADGDGFAIYRDTEKTHLYSYDSEEQKYVYSVSFDNSSEQGQMFEEGMPNYAMYLDMFEVFNGDGTSVKVGSEAVAGRNCDKYTYSMSFGTAFVKYDFWVDKDYGITLKFKVEGGDAETQGYAEFEVTSFTLNTTGPELTVPENTQGGGSGVEWPDNEFTRMLPPMDFGTKVDAFTYNGEFNAQVTCTRDEANAYFSAVSEMYTDFLTDTYDDSIIGSVETDDCYIRMSYYFEDGYFTVIVELKTVGTGEE